MVRQALLSHHKYLFNELNNLTPINNLADSRPEWSQLLEIFAEQDLEDYLDFLEEHENFLTENGLDSTKADDDDSTYENGGKLLETKMRLLTFASLAAHAGPSREIEYKQIAHALQVPSEDVERWAIDAIRAGLVSGKLTQKKKVFSVHSAKYRVFSEKQWRELGSRISGTKTTFARVLDTMDRTERDFQQQQKRDQEDAEKKLSGLNVGEGGSGNRDGGGGRGGRRRGGGGDRGGDRQRRTDNDD